MSKFRSAISQLCAIFPYVCLQFTNGSLGGYLIILTAELHKKDSEIHGSTEQISWFASLEIMRPIGTLCIGLLMERLGNRKLSFTAALLFTSSWLLFYNTTNVTILFIGRLLSSQLAIKPLTNPFISEISEPKYRGTFLAIIELVLALGSFVTLLLGSFMYWRTIAVVNFMVPIVAAVTMLFVPQSPMWLASKGRIDDAEKSLCWLRGWVKPEQIQTEFHSLLKNIQKSPSNPEERRELNNLTVTTVKKSSLHPYLEPSFYIPLGTMCLIVVFYALSGATTVTFFSTVIFRELNSPIDESIATAIMGLARVLGCLFVLLSIRHIGKRKLIFFSVIVTGLCFASVAIVEFFQSEYHWITPIAMIVFRFVNSAGIGAIISMLPSEIFPSSLRYIGASISSSASIVDSLMKIFFLYAVQAFTMPGVFLFFAFGNLAGLIVYYFLIPETEGRSLKEIEDYYEDARNAKERMRESQS